MKVRGLTNRQVGERFAKDAPGESRSMTSHVREVADAATVTLAYSYSTIVGARVTLDGRTYALTTTARYSITTSSNHMPAFRAGSYPSACDVALDVSPDLLRRAGYAYTLDDVRAVIDAAHAETCERIAETWATHADAHRYTSGAYRVGDSDLYAVKHGNRWHVVTSDALDTTATPDGDGYRTLRDAKRAAYARAFGTTWRTRTLALAGFAVTLDADANVGTVTHAATGATFAVRLDARGKVAA